MLYHVEVYMPEHAKAIVPKHNIGIVYSEHAKRAAKDDRYGEINLPKAIRIAEEHIVEICLRETKIVARIPLDNSRDLVIVIKATENPVVWFAKTVWINLRSDKHKTLDRSRYSTR